MLLNKWIQFALSVLGGLAALSASLDWSSVLGPKQAAAVAAGTFVIKAITNAFAPGRNTVAAPTGNAIVTHQ